MLIQRVRQTIAQFNMLRKGDRVIVGVSGGPDSTALLYILYLLKKEFNLKLFVAHLNHMIREGSADKDALFVKKTAEKLNLPVIIESKDIPKFAKDSNLSIEEAARNVRYDFYLRTADRFKANKIALGHTKDDQAETILMRLIRGSGLLGLSGIPPTRRLEDKTVIRPFIEVSKKEIKKFLLRKKINFRKDITNIQTIYLRNKIRHKLLPFLEEGFNPKIKKVLNETARNLRVDYDYLLKIAEKKLARYAKSSRDKVRISLKFLNEDVAIQRMIVRRAIRKVKGDLNSITYTHWEGLNNLLRKKSPWSLNLPNRISVKKIKNDVVFYKEIHKNKPDLTNVFYQLEIPGKTKIPEIGKILKADFVKSPTRFKYKRSKKEEFFDFEKIKLPLSLRFKKSGDKIIPLGMNNQKRLKQLFIDEKTPGEKRSKVPLVLSGNNIIWVCGIKRSDYARITEKTKDILKLKIL